MATRTGKWLGLALLAALTLSPLSALAEDTSAPSDVENLDVTPGDETVTLQWDPATDDTGVDGYYVYYGLDSVPDDADEYIGYEDAGDSTEYTMENLTNGMTYYFAVVAYDDAGNVSEEYSNEVDATPEQAETGDFTAPTVQGAEAMTSTLIEVEFSEDVVLPDDPAAAFTIVGTDGNNLEILDATLSDDPSYVFVVTDDQTAGATYILTVGITMEDEAGNPIVSGTSDTAIFTGSSIEGSLEDMNRDDSTDSTDTTDNDADTTEDTGDFVITDVEATEVNELVVQYTGDASELGPEDFAIQWSDDASVEVDVLAVSEEGDGSLLILTEDMESGYDYILSVDAFSLSYEFEAKTLDIADLIAPEDVTDFLASIAGEDSVMLSWTASEDSAEDLAKYIVYISTNGGDDYSDSEDVDKDETQYEWEDLEAGETYTFKITAKDENGNESEGEVSTVTLPEAGPGMAAMGVFSLLGAGFIARRRRENEL